jgi:hypothetical protein
VRGLVVMRAGDARGLVFMRAGNAGWLWCAQAGCNCMRAGWLQLHAQIHAQWAGCRCMHRYRRGELVAFAPSFYKLFSLNNIL